MAFIFHKKQKEFMDIPIDTKLVLYEGMGFGQTMEYNNEKPRLVECPQCHKQIMSIELAPKCPIDNREMITLIKDIPLRDR